MTNGAAFAARGLTTPYSVGATVSQTLFNGNQTANKVRAAESQVSAARETLRVMEQSVLLAAATVYMDMSRDSANLEVQQNNVRVLERTLTDTNNRFAAGQVTDTDVAQSEAQLAAAQATLHAAEATLVITQANYRRIIGVDPANLAPASSVERFAPVDAQFRDRARHRAESVGDCGDVRRRRRAAASQDRRRRVMADARRRNTASSSNVFPQITVAKDCSPTRSGSISRSRSIKAAVNIRPSASNKESLGQQQLNVDQVRDQTRANVVQAWAQLQAAKAQIEAAQRQNAAAERALNGVRNEAQAGQRTTQDVLNAEQALVNARQSLIVAQHDRVVASYSLLVGRGAAIGARPVAAGFGLRSVGALSASTRRLGRHSHAERTVSHVRYLGINLSALPRSIACRSAALNRPVPRNSAAVPLAVRNGKSVPNTICDEATSFVSDDNG